MPSCGENRLLLDDVESPLQPPPGAPCAPVQKTLAVRGAFVTRGQLPSLAPGRHRMRARWRDSQSKDVTIDVGP